MNREGCGRHSLWSNLISAHYPGRKNIILYTNLQAEIIVVLSQQLNKYCFWRVKTNGDDVYFVLKADLHVKEIFMVGVL
jgi:hypothetical protein